MLNLFSNIFGSSNDRILKKMMVHVNAANQLEEVLSNKPDDYFQDLKIGHFCLFKNVHFSIFQNTFGKITSKYIGFKNQ